MFLIHWKIWNRSYWSRLISRGEKCKDPGGEDHSKKEKLEFQVLYRKRKMGGLETFRRKTFLLKRLLMFRDWQKEIIQV